MTGLRIEHPGVILQEEFLEPLEITQTELARCADISYLRINELVNGKRGITPDTAMRLARVLGTTPEFWMNWQTGYDLQRVAAINNAAYSHLHLCSSTKTRK